MNISDLTSHQLYEMLDPSMNRPVYPEMWEKAPQKQAATYAEDYGLNRKLDYFFKKSEIPFIRHSEWRKYKKEGSRCSDTTVMSLINYTRIAACGVWMQHPLAEVNYLQDLIWHCCESSHWKMAAHERCHQDLMSTAFARTLMEIISLFGDTLDSEVGELVRKTVNERAISITHDYRKKDGWWDSEMNWNAVCNSNLIIAGLLSIKKPDELAGYLLPLLQRILHSLKGFSADGGCLEGVGYWGFGFGHYIRAALAMYERTGGRLNLMDDPHIEKICRYPLSAYYAKGMRASFCDCKPGWLDPGTALMINRFYKIPELYSCCESHKDGTLCFYASNLHSWNMLSPFSLLLYNGEKTSKLPSTDSLLPDLGMAKAHIPGNGGVLLALGGNNGVPHNHNDIGSFIVSRKREDLLIDPGAPLYCGDTFGSKRYQMLKTRSLGHSVPIINGNEQHPGSEFYAVITAENLNGKGIKKISLDMSRSYPDKTLKKFIRVFTLTSKGEVQLKDSLSFSRKPKSIEESFITTLPVTIRKNGREAVVEGKKSSLKISAPDIPGAFSLQRLEEQPQWKEPLDKAELNRVIFMPEICEKELRLVFIMK